MCSSCDCHVSIMQLSCVHHVTVMCPSCDCHVFMHMTLSSSQPLASVNEDHFHFTVQGVRIEEELRERCRNSTVANTPTGPFCAERVNASVTFNVQGRVRKGEGMLWYCARWRQAVGGMFTMSISYGTPHVCLSVRLSVCLHVRLSVV